MSGREKLGSYLLTWPDGVFPLGGDTLALGEFSTVRRGWRVCDLGTGSGALLLLLAGRQEQLTLTGIELDPVAAETARDNLAANGLLGEILTQDLRTAALPAGRFDLVISNPPYFAAGTGGDGGAARMERGTLVQLCKAAARLLKNGGRFALCHRPERLCDLMCVLRECGLEPKRMQLLAHMPGCGPSTVLLEAVRQGRPGLEILPTAYHEAGSMETKEKG